MFKTRIQTTEKLINNKRFIGTPELVPVHPLGDEVFTRVLNMKDDAAKYVIKTEDGTIYEWWIAVYVNEKKGYTADFRNCVTRIKGDCHTWWEEPSTINQIIDNNPYGIYAQYKNDGSIILHYNKGFASGETHYYSPKNNLVEPIRGVESIGSFLDEY